MGTTAGILWWAPQAPGREWSGVGEGGWSPHLYPSPGTVQKAFL